MPRPPIAAVALVAASLFLTACAETEFVVYAAKQIKHSQESPDTEAESGRYKVGDPYKIDGVYYYPAVDYAYSETGVASWYGEKFHGRSTANGEMYDMNELTAAHRTLPMPSVVRVVNLDNGRILKLKVNDRGPFARGRIIDVSRRAAQLLGFRYRGTARVRVEIIADESRGLAALAQGKILADDERIAPLSAPTAKSITTAELSPPSPPSPAPPLKTESVTAPPPPEAAPGESTFDIEPVRPTALYVQAGAFLQYANAARLRTKLAGFAPAQVTEAHVGSEKFFRVRLGPFQSLGKADVALDMVAASGYPRARLIVE